jgi:Zn-dependent M16 (insulinase) family peptidase
MIKAILANTLDFEDLSDFLKKFKKFVLRFTRNVIGIFIEELSNEIKKNIKRLVSSVIKDIKDELKNKQIVMYTAILEALLIVGKGILDYRQCKSVIDDILKLLKLIG